MPGIIISNCNHLKVSSEHLRWPFQVAWASSENAAIGELEVCQESQGLFTSQLLEEITSALKFEKMTLRCHDGNGFSIICGHVLKLALLRETTTK